MTQLDTESRLRIVALREALALVGERWTLLVVREVALGLRRYGELQEATGAPRTVLSDRLRRLVVAGLLETRPYQVPGARPREEYALTDAGRDLLPVLAALADWSERHLPAVAPTDVTYRHAGCGGRVRARLICSCGTETSPGDRLVASVDRQESR